MQSCRWISFKDVLGFGGCSEDFFFSFLFFSFFFLEEEEEEALCSMNEGRLRYFIYLIREGSVPYEEQRDPRQVCSSHR